MPSIEHCRHLHKVDKTYRVADYKDSEALYILSAACKVCGNTFYHTVRFDIWGKREPLEGTYLATGKAKHEYAELIRTGRAVQVVRINGDAKDARAGVAGVGEWTRKAGKSHEYVLRSLWLLKTLPWLPNRLKQVKA